MSITVSFKALSGISETTTSAGLQTMCYGGWNMRRKLENEI
jgi:hypothetical protein